MGWPYHFVDLSEPEKQVRRATLAKYALAAELSDLFPAAIILLFWLGKWVFKSREETSGGYAAIPSSPLKKKKRQDGGGAALDVRLRKVKWWLGEDVVVSGSVLGQRDQWIVGLIWLTWLLVLSVLETDGDYLHLTKRFGLIAVSQYPLQYILALKSLNPFSYLLQTGHEHVNRWHRVMSRITTALLYLHMAFYLAFFVMTNRLYRLGAPVVAAGVVAFFLLNLMITTALRPLRKFSYRLFFVIHLISAIAIPILILIHATPARGFAIQTLVAFFVDLISRKMDTVTAHATFETIPGTNLIKVSATIPHRKINRFRGNPGSHIYLSLPAAARHSSDPTSISHLLFEFLFNPFTVASAEEGHNSEPTLTLVARHSGGPMTAALGRYARAAKPITNNTGSIRNEDKIPLNIEGPYGAVTHFPHFSSGDFDRILLVAGGVGATFTVPLYRSIINENPSARVQMIWAIRDAGDATWAFTSAGGDAQSILNDDNVQIFITGNTPEPERAARSSSSRTRLSAGAEGGGSSGSDAGDIGGSSNEVEMNAMYRDRRRGKYTSQHNRKRPDLKQIVDDLFKFGQEERVAVLVCGPREMASELREHVGFWVDRGRSVWWHKEGFGF
ncbi:Ferric/cupric reductase transmembrane component 2 [Podospora australis]|uniref:Ferric/cupric reductase transmembrane component 2 n=1 Tax=Podospora australis TaxID=1536484 RepID=A0AAN6X2T6_9PEZI|nr:Ferric/cupric reductase transmembrane component 2 [Podospora australis]